MAVLFDDQISRAAAAAQTVANGDVYTIQGDCLTAGTAAIANRYLGAITVSEGTLLVDGDVSEIGVANTTNATVGQSIAGGTSGATAVITQLISSTRIKYRATNNLAFSNGETISGGSFSAAANTAPSLSTLMVLGNQGTAITTQTRGSIKTRGLWYQLGVSNGTANQTFTSPFPANAVLPAVWVQIGFTVTIQSTATLSSRHLFSNGQTVKLVGGLTGTGFNDATIYYVVSSDQSGLTGDFGSSFSLALTKNGTAIAATGAASATVLAAGTTFSCTNGSTTLTSSAGHSYAVNDALSVVASVGGFNARYTYYVVATSGNDFALSLTRGGTPIAATASGTGETLPGNAFTRWLNVVDRNLTAFGNGANHGEFCKQTIGATSITFGDEGTSVSTTATFTNGSTTITTGAAHGRAIGDVVRLTTTGTLAGNFATATDYYVLTVPSTTSLTVSTLPINSAIAASGTGTGTHTLIPQIGGRIPPNGALIRCQNILLGNTSSGTAPVPQLPATASYWLLNTSSFGQISLERSILCGFLIDIANPTTLLMQGVSVFGYMQVSNTGTRGVINNFALTNNNALSPTIAFSLASTDLDLSDASALSTNNTTAQIQSAQGTTINRCNFNNTRSNSTATALNISSVQNIVITNSRFIGANLKFANYTNVTVLYPFTSSNNANAVNQNNSQSCYQVTANGSNLLINYPWYGSPFGDRLIQIDAAVFTVRLANFGTSNRNYSLLNNTNVVVAATAALSTIESLRLTNFFVTNARNAYLSQPNNATIKNLQIKGGGSVSSGFDAARVKAGFVLGWRNGYFGSVYGTFTAFAGVHFFQRIADNTNLELALLFFEKIASDYYSNLSYTITAGAPTFASGGNGTLNMITGDQIRYLTPFPIYKFTALASIATSTTGTIDFQYRIAAGKAAPSGAFKAMSSSNLAAETVSATTGFRIEIQITCTATGTVSGFRLLGATSLTAQAAYSYPASTASIVVTGIVPDSTIGLFDESNNLIEAAIVPGTSYTFAPIDFDTPVAYTYKLRRYGYYEYSATILLADGTTIDPAIQLVNPLTSLSSAAAAALTGISVDHNTQTITQTANRTLSELRDYLQYDATLLTNIGRAIPYTTINGTDLTLTYSYSRSSCALTGTGSLSLPTKTATITGDTSSGQLPVTDSTGLRFRVYGLPASNNPVMRSKRVSNSVITNPAINSNGEAYFTIALGEDYQLRADAIGYNASGFITINSNSATSVQISLAQVLDANGAPVYGQGIAGEKALITFNPATLTISIAYSALYPTISLFSAFDKIEELLATTTAIEFTAHPIYNNGTIFFPRDILTNAANPARIQADSGNTGTPTLTFQIVDQASTTPYNLFNFSNGKFINYPTTVNVAQVQGDGSFTVSDRTQLTALNATLATSGVFSTAALANAPTGSGGGGSGLDAAGVRAAIGLAAANLDTQLTSINTNIDQIPTTDYAPNITAIKAKTDQLSFTTANRVDSTAVAVSDKTGFSLATTQAFNLTGNITGNLSGSVGSVTNAVSLPAIPNNWITAAGVATDAIDADALATSAITEIQAGLSTYAGSDTSGVTTLLGRLTSGRATNLDNLNASVAALPTLSQIEASTVLFKASSYTAPANSSILSAIGAIPTTPLLANDGRLNNLDATISSRQASFTYIAPNNAGIASIQSTLAAIQGTTFNTATDSLEAIRDRGDTAWTTATGFSTFNPATQTVTLAVAPPTANQIAAAVESALADDFAGVTIDLTPVLNAIDPLPTLTEIEASTVLFKVSNYTAPNNTAIAAIKAKTDNLPTSPASTSDVQVTVSGGFTNDDRATLGSIPTDKIGYALTGAEKTAVAIAVETQLSSEFNAIPNALEIRQELDANSTRLSAIAANAELSRQGVSNRYKIDEANNTGTLYDDDGVTPLVVHTLTDKDGNPASESTYERVPQ